ncbi:MAG: 5-methyltetrahydropteroyltriglutamate--homocysteine S-methyltransferase [Verrucomicrobiaceae bacterium]|nr:5-methyltetrahydropteroyltriglutamate--homocysteine S-methyltransferase [Verrucomicrobiaceae bacterium]
MTSIKTQNLGYPRIGAKRELKRALERHWSGDASLEELEAEGARLRKLHWETQCDAGLTLIPSNDFSYYDQILDQTCLLGNVPARFGWDGGTVTPELYFRMARGGGAAAKTDGCCGGGTGEYACEMTKWFDTNYHYLVPEFDKTTVFRLSTTKVFDEYSEARALGIETVPVLVGPLTYLHLGKEKDQDGSFDRYDLLDGLLDGYVEILRRLAELGAGQVRFDEPALALDLGEAFANRYQKAYQRFAAEVPGIEIEVAVYFGELRGNLPTLLSLPVAGIHFDAVRGRKEVDTVIEGLAGSDKHLSLGLIDGRNIWKTDLKAALQLAKKAIHALGPDRVLLAPSCSLLHVPVRLASETELDPELVRWLAFADEKLAELSLLAAAAAGNREADAALLANEEDIFSRRRSERVCVPAVRARLAALREEQFTRHAPFETRRKQQIGKLNLPPVPTTTIGSFPQTKSIRDARAKFRRGEWTEAQYETFLRLSTSECVKWQEKVGLDVLVHGEFERNDMVEYFGEQLDGFAFTRFGWVQSYGSRCVKPPILFGDVSRPAPMTVDWARYAQSQTTRPMKGMLTGPVTILQWSFVRDDQPRRETAFQIALAIRDEVVDLEQAGLPIIQIDEAAIREGLPLRQSDRADYFDWAVRAFRLSASGVDDATQIHTHMCYSEFNDMLEAIVAMDADVITIENTRSDLDLLNAFADFAYPNEIGPGVYDIHSPRIPSSAEMLACLNRAATVIPADRLWANPDCGLKTRGWAEVEPALANMVEAVSAFRRQLAAR